MSKLLPSAPRQRVILAHGLQLRPIRLNIATERARAGPAFVGRTLVATSELIERLPPRERTILVLHYGHGYALDEIASLLGINYATVRSRIARTRIRLFREWTEADR